MGLTKVGKSVWDTINNIYVNLISDLANAEQEGIIYVSGELSVNDGGGGFFKWESSEARSTADGYYVVDPTGTGIGNGCWVRQLVGSTNNTQVERQVISGTQSTVTLTGLSYIVGSNNLAVYVNGVRLSKTADYTETSSTVITFTESLLDGDEFVAVVNDSTSTAHDSASTVVYTPNGTGAVTTDVQTKLREFVSVKDFGAVGDGVTDDTAAIQAAIDYVQGQPQGVLYFPPRQAGSYYKTTDELLITKTISIVGSNTIGVEIIAVGLSAGEYVLKIDCNPTDVVEAIRLENITLRSNNQLPNGLYIKDSSYMSVKNLRLYNLATGILVTGTRCFSNYFEKLSSTQLTGVNFEMDAFSGGGHWTFNSCTFTGNTGFIVRDDATTDSLSFINCNFEQCTISSLYVNGTVRGLNLSGCRTEGLNGAVDFQINPAATKSVTGLSITGCSFTTDNLSSYPIQLGGAGGSVRGFNITGNQSYYTAQSNFVYLNGEGESGLISGNYFAQPATTPTNANRAGVIVFGNENSSGKCDEEWGFADWGVVEGSFTPTVYGGTIAGDATPSVSTGKYQKIGNLVTIWISVSNALNSYTTKPTGAVKIGGLPYSSTMVSVGTIHGNTVDFTKGLEARIENSNDYIDVYVLNGVAAGADDANLDWAAVRDPYADFWVSLSYYIG